VERVSQKIKQKAQELLEQEAVKKEYDTLKRIYFVVEGKTETHSVFFDKEKSTWFCDCRYFSLRRKTCSHILACKLFLIGRKIKFI
jgi:hypothetical protein